MRKLPQLSGVIKISILEDYRTMENNDLVLYWSRSFFIKNIFVDDEWFWEWIWGAGKLIFEKTWEMRGIFWRKFLIKPERDWQEKKFESQNNYLKLMIY